MTVLNRSFVEEWSNAYAEHAAFEHELHLLTVGAAARAVGHLALDEFIEIAKWKSPRPARRYQLNDAETVRAVTSWAFAAEPWRRAELLDGRLSGVKIRTASAILTVVFPTVHTVLDYRAVDALRKLVTEAGEPGLDRDLKAGHWDFHYWIYNERCVQLASSLGVQLRSLDRALWQWSKKNYPTWP